VLVLALASVVLGATLIEFAVRVAACDVPDSPPANGAPVLVAGVEELAWRGMAWSETERERKKVFVSLLFSFIWHIRRFSFSLVDWKKGLFIFWRFFTIGVVLERISVFDLQVPVQLELLLLIPRQKEELQLCSACLKIEMLQVSVR
jgi:hypothetical protein